ncbi:kappa-type opioid receptor-like [Anneissia japonica]|uniref:kappa-type opioid receptor-like n=1 Tax=Anneissia japonica TaxID=1529436 RepID=UPI0014257847|nr:kappa-type opioid receptor-like [Anneissia japonica]
MSSVNTGSHKHVPIENTDNSINYNEYWADHIEPLLYTDLDKVIIPIIMPIVVTIGIIGNVLTIIVIASKNCMHTPVNMYFANLAIADTLFLINASGYRWNSYIKSPVIDTYDIGETPKWFCPLNGFLENAGVDVALLTMFWLSVERYMAICRPFKFKQSGFGICSMSIKICGIIWFLGLSWNVYFLVGEHTFTYEISWPIIAVDTLPNTFTICVLRWYEFHVIYWYVTRALNVLMIVIIVALYTAMLISLRKSRGIAISSAGREPTSKSECKVFLTVFVTVTVYVVCTAPFYIYVVLFRNGIAQLNHSPINIYRLMFYINSSVNPVIYNGMNYNFRRAFYDVYCSRCSRKKNIHTNVQI